MQCHGKCYLKANLLQQEEDNQKPIINFENELVKWFYFKYALAVEPGSDKSIALGFVYLFYIPEHCDPEVFRPPLFLV